jgi:hypothetical protein
LGVQFGVREKAAAVGMVDGQHGAREVEADAQPRADEGIPQADGTQHLPLPVVDEQVVGFGVVEVVFLDAVVFVEELLLDHLGD